MAAVQPEQIAEARRCAAERRRWLTDSNLLFTSADRAVIVLDDALEDLLASCRELTRLLAALRGSKKLTLTEEQHRALQEPYARGVAAITNAGGQP